MLNASIKVKKLTKTSRKTNNEWFEIQDSIAIGTNFKQKIVWARLMKSRDLRIYHFRVFHLFQKVYTVDSLCFITGEHLEYLTKF